MRTVGEREIRTQRRVAAFFQDVLGYVRLGDWRDRAGNANVEEAVLTRWLQRRGHDDKVIGKVMHELRKAAAVGGSRMLYDANRAVYGLLRYGVKVRPEAGEQTVTVPLIDWERPADNDFAIAEEVTVAGANTRRPDLVLYVNGLALGVLELKRSTVSVTEGIRQNLDSQQPAFIRPFYATVQLLMAGNETEGLRYGVIGTPEKQWLRWKEAEAHPTAGDNPLLRELGQVCGKERLLEIVHDFIVFDAGVKKACRHNQYFGVRAAQAHVKRREGGIIWHTQGSGKSLTMVWLAKWIREHVPNGRVLIITDRTELDEQIEMVFLGVSEQIHRTTSGADLVHVLHDGAEWLIASLIHKFGASDEATDRDVETWVREIRKSLPGGFQAKGEIFVFVDECHRTQSGKLHEAMTDLLPGAMPIGFTGTPLLKADKKRSIETFGPYIHTYKYDEAVGDGVVLDLRYEARDIDQQLTSPAKVVDKLLTGFDAPPREPRRGGRDHREQRPPDHHRRDGGQPQVLHADVRAARRPDSPAQAGGVGLPSLLGEDRRSDQADQQPRGAHVVSAGHRQRRGAGAVRQPGCAGCSRSDLAGDISIPRRDTVRRRYRHTSGDGSDRRPGHPSRQEGGLARKPHERARGSQRYQKGAGRRRGPRGPNLRAREGPT